VVRACDKTEAVVVVGPDHTYLQEANDVPQVGRPLPDEFPEEGRPRRLVFKVGYPDLYDEERDRDGEHPVGEGLDPGRVVFAARRSTTGAHAEASS
jgi:hypothetical protein